MSSLSAPAAGAVNPPAGSGDFRDLLLRTNGPAASMDQRAVSPANAASLHTEATTVLSFHYKDGVLIAGDRRATAGNIVMYDRADKVIELDANTVMAIAGTPATAFEMARTLQTSFQYYRRSQLQALSMSAKVRALGKLIKDNLPMTLQGVGVVVPILAARDAVKNLDPELFFYDALGAQFQAVDFAVSGSGSPAVRSVLQWINRWSTLRTAGEPEPLTAKSTAWNWAPSAS